MKGVIVNFVRGGGRQYNNKVIVKVLDASSQTIGKVIGGKAIYVDKYGNKYVGRILRRHGARNSLVLVRFKPNIPGQALGSIVEIIPSKGS
jgi:large subunit ribosomal protein L35Ae